MSLLFSMRCGLCTIVRSSRRGFITWAAIDPDHNRSPRLRYQSAIVLTAGDSAMTKPIPDKAEVALEYPDKLYIGTFERSARFDAHLDQTGISLGLERPGDAESRRAIRMHLHYALLAEILKDLAQTVPAMPPDDTAHREVLRDGA